jgi:two-component system cell cycle sensor histidine kinase/response regulator CckA
MGFEPQQVTLILVLAVAVSLVLGAGIAAVYLRRRTATLKAALDALPRPAQLVTGKGRVLSSNRACARLFGTTGRPVPELLRAGAAGQEESQKAIADLAGKLEAGRGGEIEVRLKLAGAGEGDDSEAGGRDIWCRVAAVALPGATDEHLWILEDVTERHATEQAVARAQQRYHEISGALTRSEQRFRHFFDEIPVGIAQLDLNGKLTECNKAFEEMAGEPRGAMLGRALIDYLDEEYRAPVLRALFGLRRGEGAVLVEQPIEVRLAGPRDLVCALTLRGLDGDGGVPVGATAHLLDTTEQRALELQFTQSQKMQAVGQLAGGIAHDFNNLLTAMIGFSDLLLLRHRPGEQSFADIMQIKQNANRAANLVRQLLAFSRQQTLQPRVLNITEILGELSHLLRRLIGERIELQVIHGRDLGPVRADQGQLEQVIINLAVNARDAMPNGGRLSIKTSNLTQTTPRRIKSETVPPGDYVVMEMSDTGSGIAKDNMDRIFDPFFSTKGVGEGTGLGLSTVYGIVKQTGGFVQVESSLGLGTTFTIFLPRYGEPAVVGEAEAEPARIRDLTGIGTVLLVEDEDAVRTFSARALRNKGYDVLEAASGEGALELLIGGARDDPAKVHKTDVDLLITDVVMPKIDGPALVERVREHNPEIKVIFISGYAEDSFRQRLGEDRELHFLPKPFSLKQLASKVKEVMNQPPD